MGWVALIAVARFYMYVHTQRGLDAFKRLACVSNRITEAR